MEGKISTDFGFFGRKLKHFRSIPRGKIAFDALSDA